MKISAIKAQVKTLGRYSVFVEGKFAFGISELGLVNSELRVGQEVSEADLEKLKNTAQIDKMYNKVLELIMRRPRSQWEIEDYLKRKLYNKIDNGGVRPSEEIINVVMSQLTERGFVDDVDFTRRWIANRRLLKPTSKRKLMGELRQKRINDEIINQTLAEDETDEQDVIRAEIEKKRRQTRYQDNQKLIAYLARQGYRYDDIKAALQD